MNAQKNLPAVAETGLIPSDLIYAKQWGRLAKEARIVPVDMNEVQAAAIVQTGRELGLQPLQSLRNMSFINGRVTMSVQLQLALAKAGGVRLPEGWLKETEGKCTATLQRGDEHVTCTYTLDDARKAGLTRAGGSYDKYQKQMLRWRAIGDCLRLIAPDLVMGLLSPEEAASIEPVEKEKNRPQEGDAKSLEDAGAMEQGDGLDPKGSGAGRENKKAEQDGKEGELFGHPESDVGVLGDDSKRKPVVAGEEKQTPKPHKKGMAGFLEAMSNLKAEMHALEGSNASYYSVLDHYALKHANEVETEGAMRSVYLHMKAEKEHLVNEAQAKKLLKRTGGKADE